MQNYNPIPAKTFRRFILHLLLSVFCASGIAQTTIPNPVVPGVADAGIINFNGDYYLGGVHTNGTLYTSRDLIHWKQSGPVLTMNNEWATPFGIGGEQIHSDDLNYINGQFHFYWNVNRWSRERNVIHIGHAVSNSIAGPFIEPVKATWFDNRLDPKLFVDDDGSLYFYSVKFSDGNTIWGRRMKDPATFDRAPIEMFSSRQHTWETMDNRVAEGPWVMKYRGRYYMLYNANHTDPAWGNYALGVAEAASPLGFNEGNKYPHPILQSNQVDFEELHPDLLKYQSSGGAGCRYTLSDPGEHWMNNEFNDSAWATGGPHFGSNSIEGSTTRKVNTAWTTRTIWIRKKFIFTDTIANIAMRVHQDGPVKIHLNGRVIYESSHADYQLIVLDSGAKAALKSGANMLSIECSKGQRSNYLDVSLYNLKNEPADDILFTPGQANVVKGPNGFEYWLVYMANKNNEPRGQYIDRIFFHDRKLTIDGITSAHTAGYHAPPRAAGFADTFDDSSTLHSNWQRSRGEWQISNNELVSKSSTTEFIKAPPASNYILQASVKCGPGNAAGLYAYWHDTNNWVKVGLDSRRKTWTSGMCVKGKLTSRSVPLPQDFNFDVYHQLNVEKNGSRFALRIDQLPAAGGGIIPSPFVSNGSRGLYADEAGAHFDGVMSTAGWDEYGTEITAWKGPTGEIVVSDSGIGSLEKGAWMAWKGDRLRQYEFSAHISTARASGFAGIYPIYGDSNNYMRFGIDFNSKKLLVSVRSNGKIVSDTAMTLANKVALFANMTESDFMETHFNFEDTVELSRLQIKRAASIQNDSLLPSISDKTNIAYLANGQWNSLSEYRADTVSLPGFETLSFKPFRTSALLFTNRDANDRHSYVYKIWAEEVCKDNYELRAVRCDGLVRLFVDNKLLAEIPDVFPASAVGLCTTDNYSHFNGITFFEIP